MITEYDRFSEEEDVFKKSELPDALKSDELVGANQLNSTPDDMTAFQMNSEKKALHQITVGEKGDGEDTNLAANVGFEDQFRLSEGSDLEANNNVDP